MSPRPRAGFARALGLALAAWPWSGPLAQSDTRVAAEVAARTAALRGFGVAEEGLFEQAARAATGCAAGSARCDAARACLDLAAARAAAGELESWLGDVTVTELPSDAESPLVGPARRALAEAEARVRTARTEVERADATTLARLRRERVARLSRVAALERHLASRHVPADRAASLELARARARRASEEAALEDDAYRARRGLDRGREPIRREAATKLEQALASRIAALSGAEATAAEAALADARAVADVDARLAALIALDERLRATARPAADGSPRRAP